MVYLQVYGLDYSDKGTTMIGTTRMLRYNLVMSSCILISMGIHGDVYGMIHGTAHTLEYGSKGDSYTSTCVFKIF